MRLLFATSLVPDGRAGSGYEIATAAVIDALRRTGADVTILGFAWPDSPLLPDPDTILLGRLDPRTDAAPLGAKLGWLAQSIRADLPFSAAKLRVLAPSYVAAALRGHGAFDACVLNSVQFAAAFESVFRGRPSLFVAHNVEHRSAAENAETAGSAVARAMFRREARLLARVEARLCRAASHVWAFADEDRAALNLEEARSTSLPLVTRREPPQAAPRRIEYDAALIGTWTWAPNRVGLLWFLERVVPLLPEGFRVRVAGHVAPELAAAHPRVDFVGRVDDATEFVRKAAAVPLVAQAGTGVQLKTIETFELGLPSVATTRSLRGVAHLPENCRVADDPADFARALVALSGEKAPALDGSQFHEAQRGALDAGVRRGLASLAPGIAEQAAA